MSTKAKGQEENSGEITGVKMDAASEDRDNKSVKYMSGRLLAPLLTIQLRARYPIQNADLSFMNSMKHQLSWKAQIGCFMNWFIIKQRMPPINQQLSTMEG